MRQVIKQLKVKGIRARCPYPAQLDAQIPMLNAQIDERERLQRELTKDGW